MFKKKFDNEKSNFKKTHSYKNKNENTLFDKNEYHKNQASCLNHSCHVKNSKSNILYQEFLCHLPMSILALSISLFLLIFFDGFFNEIITLTIKKNIYSNLFHMSHYMHILFASFASFYAFSNTFISEKKFWIGFLLAIINSFLFCTLADIILPSLGAFFLDKSITMHFCFLHYTDLLNTLFFSFFGIFASYCLLKGNIQYANLIARKVHLGHVWFGCVSALLYLFSQIKIDIISNISFLFVLLFFSVIIPCIFSDIFMPYFFYLYINKKNQYQGIQIQYH